MRQGDILWVVVAVVLGTGVGGGQCQVSCPPVGGNETVLLPDPTDCSKFYICDNGTPVSVDCPLGLVFDPTKGYCESPSVYQCTVSTPGVSTTTTRPPVTSTVPPTSSTAAPPVKCRTSSGIEFIANPDAADCKTFYTCVDGVLRPELSACPADLLFDPVINQCNSPESVFCPGAPTTTTTPVTTRATTTSTTSPVTTRATTTSPTTTWSTATPAPTTTNPGPTTTTRPAPTTTGQPGFPDCDPQVPSTHPYPGNCTLYIVCVHGSMTLYKCPEGMAFDSFALECRDESVAVCGSNAAPSFPVLLRDFQEPTATAAEAKGAVWELRRNQRLNLQKRRVNGAPRRER